jgi:hypothetical protein
MRLIPLIGGNSVESAVGKLLVETVRLVALALTLAVQQEIAARLNEKVRLASKSR